jgi:hypothetical protein
VVGSNHIIYGTGMVEFIEINETNKVVQALEANLFSYFTNFGRTPLGELLAFKNAVH